MTKTIKLLALLSVFSLFASSAGLVFGQAARAVINGTVVDPSGAAVPGAVVTIENSSLGLTRKVETTNAGFFTSPDLSPAAGYTVAVSKEGFTNYTVNPFTLAVGQQLGFNITL